MVHSVMVHIGQKVITSHGTTVIVAFVRNNQVWAWYRGKLQPVIVRGDAWGGEHDLALMNAA